LAVIKFLQGLHVANAMGIVAFFVMVQNNYETDKLACVPEFHVMKIG
jgi:hypothetical protein